MTFDELLDAACKSAGLPSMARILFPSTLSEETKKRDHETGARGVREHLEGRHRSD